MADILCAEDDHYVQDLLRTILTRRDHSVRICQNGREALESFDEQPPDLLLLDMMMPGVSGEEVLARLQERPAAFTVPIIVISGLGDEQSITQALSSGAVDYIVKPFTRDELMAKVNRQLQRRQQDTSPTLDSAVGSIFADRYRILDRLEAGGFSTVYRAQDMRAEDHPIVALKVFDLPDSQQADRRFKTMFLREAYEMSKLDHPNIVRFHEFGQYGRFYFLAMEFLEGRSLQDLVEAHGPILDQDVMLITRSLVQAMAYMAERGLIHRDLKPANIMITQDGTIKLLDFGLAKRLADESITSSQQFRGTPSFASPEYIDGSHAVDLISDLYSLGVTLYFALTGVILFSGRTPSEILDKHHTVKPPRLEAPPYKIWPPLARLVHGMLSKSRDDRPTIEQILAIVGESSTDHASVG